MAMKFQGYFEGKELELAEQMKYSFNDEYSDENIIKEIENIYKTYTIEEIEFALNFMDFLTKGFVTMKDYFRVKKMKLIDILKWIKNSEGIYFAVSNDGTRGMVYLEKPKKSQVEYQRKKNGKRIVFLSFKDWKEYLMNEG